MGTSVRRREFILVIGGAAIAWRSVALGQQQAMPLIGFLSSRSPHESAGVLRAFHEGLAETGYSEGRNISIEYQWAEGRYDRLQALAEDLVRLNVAVLVTTGGEPSALAAKAATSTIPHVFTVGGDPVKIGLVQGLGRPGGNATGVSLMTSTPEAKRLGLLQDVAPRALIVGVLVNPHYQEAQTQLMELQDAARSISRTILPLYASNETDIDVAFAALVKEGVGALIVTADPFLLGPRDKIVRLAATHAVPTIYFSREFAEVGGLMSYGANIATGYRQVGVYTGRILRGEKPADLPVVQSRKFDFVVNLKTANTLGLDISPGLLALADEVIE
jgi:putative ABC transport system substrate-binding protein